MVWAEESDDDDLSKKSQRGLAIDEKTTTILSQTNIGQSRQNPRLPLPRVWVYGCRQICLNPCEFRSFENKISLNSTIKLNFLDLLDQIRPRIWSNWAFCCKILL